MNSPFVLSWCDRRDVCSWGYYFWEEETGVLRVMLFYLY